MTYFLTVDCKKKKLSLEFYTKRLQKIERDIHYLLDHGRIEIKKHVLSSKGISTKILKRERMTNNRSTTTTSNRIMMSTKKKEPQVNYRT